MAGSVNKVILIGRLGKDPEMRFTTSGKAVTTFSMATDEAWTDQNSEKQKRTEWHRIVVWGKLAETCAKYLSKGKLVYVEGRIQTREWTDKEGNKRYATEIVANVMQILSPVESPGSKDFEDNASTPPENDPFADDVPF